MGDLTFKKIREEFAPFFRQAQKINSTEARVSTVIKKGSYEAFLEKVISHQEIPTEDKVLIVLMYSTGCRVSEIVGQDEESGIRVEQIDLVKMRVNGVKILKKRGRTLKLQKALFPGAAELFRTYLQGKGEGELVVSLSRKAAARRLAKYFGFTDIHSTRHSFCTNAMEQGIDPVKLSYMQGWSDARFGFRYLNCDTEEELDGLFKKKAA